MASIQKALQKKRKSGISRSESVASETVDNSRVPVAAESGMFKASLEATPGMKLHHSCSVQSTSLNLFCLKYQLISEAILTAHKMILCPLGIDKITEKAQMSEEGTMVSVPDAPPTAGTSDTQCNSDQGHKVAPVAPAAI